MRLATADYSFPLLDWHQAVRLTRDLGFEGIDVSLFQGRSQLRPEEVFARPSLWAATVRQAIADHGLAIADVFGIPATNFESAASNHPDPAQRKSSREFFARLLEFAAECRSKHVTILPGVHFESETQDDSLKRSAEELLWRVVAAKDIGITLAVEAHTGSIIATPGLARTLLDLVPGLTLTLDPAHFAYRGVKDSDILPLTSKASHFHARCARPGRLQAPFKENCIDFNAYMRALRAKGYREWIAIEYVWIDWEHCNEVDVLSETVLLKQFFGTLQEGACPYR